MKAETFESLEKNYKDQPSELREAIKNYILSLGITPSRQYVLVLEFILRNPNHPTVDDIFDSLNKAMPELSRSRIYSILDILYSRGAVEVIRFDESTIYYDGNTLPHAHLLCDKCGSVIDIKLCEDMQERASSVNGVKIRKAQLLCEGLCPACLKSEKVH